MLPPCAAASAATSLSSASEQVSGACGAQSQRMRPPSCPFQRAISAAFSASEAWPTCVAYACRPFASAAGSASCTRPPMTARVPSSACARASAWGKR